jgi:cell division septation protein DedD
VGREQKPRRTASRKPVRSGGGVIVGVFIGLVLGALLAAGTAWYFTRSSPFQAPPATPAIPSGDQPPMALPGKPGDRPLVRQDFEFYKILPQGTAAPTDPAAAGPGPEPPRVERLYLQVGAFENPAEADNMKALLALNGIEASAQRAQLDDGRIVHRVRIGPFAKPEDMNPVRARLASAGLSASVVRVNQ